MQVLQALFRSQIKQQDEQDRRWRNLCAYMDKRKAEGNEVNTGGAFMEAFVRYGYAPYAPLPKSKHSVPMDFPTFQAAVGGGWSMRDTYEAQGEPDAPAKCECCKTPGAAMRCSWCGEYYCSTACQQKDWKDHRPTCIMVAENRGIEGRGVPRNGPPLQTADKYAAMYGLRRPVGVSAAAGSGASAGSAAAVHQAGGAAAGGASRSETDPKKAAKNAKKKAKKREKKAAAAAAAAAPADAAASSHPAEAEAAAAAAAAAVPWGDDDQGGDAAAAAATSSHPAEAETVAAALAEAKLS